MGFDSDGFVDPQLESQLTAIFGPQVDQPPSDLRGILQTKDYDRFMILSDTGDLLFEFNGSKQANRCLPGDHV